MKSGRVMDCNEMYNQIVAFSEACYGIPRHYFERHETLYYDETGNDVHVVVEQGELNLANPNNFFVLGGLQAEAVITEDDFEKNFTGASGELKSTRVIKGDFNSVLQGEYISRLCGLVHDMGWHIHYFALQPLYYSFVDIIDSLDIGSRDRFALKDLLYEVLKNDLDHTVEVFRKNGGYPNIMHAKKDVFLCAVLALIDDYVKAEHCEDRFRELRKVIELGKQQAALDFVQDEESNVWVDDYSQFYAQQIMKFCRKRMVFDNNDKVRRCLEQRDFACGGIPVDWIMVDSANNRMVQISDLIVGLVRKFLMFVDRDDGLIRHDIGMFDDVQKRNFEAFIHLVKFSQQYNPLFVEYCASIRFVRKVNRLVSMY